LLKRLNARPTGLSHHALFAASGSRLPAARNLFRDHARKDFKRIVDLAELLIHRSKP
jgi:hypothetical protein